MEPSYVGGNESQAFDITNENEIESTSKDCSSGRTRKKTSSIWEHYSQQAEDGKYICNYCSRGIVGGGRNGTNGLLGHHKSCPELKKKMRKGDGSGSASVKVGEYVFDELDARRKLADMIVKHEYPLSIVDHDGFKSFCHSLQPLFQVVSRNTIKRDIFKIFEYEKERTMNLLNTNSSRIAITTDMWTANNQKRGFMAVTAHFIDDSWSLNSRLVRFIYVPCPHTADILATALMDCLTDWKIDDKLSSLTVDNCTTNDAMLEELLGKLSFSSQLLDVELFHMRCCAHILNLIVRDGLEVIGTSIERIRSCVAYWTATQKREEKFMEMVKALNIKSNKKLILDCKTRWNSTYLMLETAMIYKEVFPRLKREYKNVPSDEDWALSRVIAEKFRVFYKVTLVFSGTKYPTANLYFPNVCEIRIAIDRWLVSEQRDVRLMAQKMSMKFDKYWTIIHGMMALATILDPRYKMHLIEYYFPLIYKNNHSSEVERIKELANHLTHHYQLSLQASQQSSQSSVSPSLRSYDLEDDDHMASFDQFVSNKKKKDMVKSELDTYLEETLMPRTANFDILSWWKTNGTKYPVLQAMARDILAIPVSTVASESAFSTSGRIVSKHRSRLQSDTLEALMCARDWMWKDMQAAGISSKADYTFDDDFDLEEATRENITLYD